MEHNRHSHLTLLRIGRVCNKMADTEDVIDEFESRKGRFKFFF